MINNITIKEVVEKQLHQYPETTLKDIYKSFFQDEYGPGHLLDNTAAARKYFEYELSIMQSKGNYEDEPCGLGKNFYRASMDRILDGMVDKDDYFNSFILSSTEFKMPDIEAWKMNWEAIFREVLTLKDRIYHFDEDSIEIKKILDSGEYVVHHSERYVKAYRPHYRIMSQCRLVSVSP